VPDASKTTLAWSFAAFGRSDLWVALITFLYLDFLDATGTLFSMGESLRSHRPYCLPGLGSHRAVCLACWAPCGSILSCDFIASILLTSAAELGALMEQGP